jgi:predicted ester cyclase
LIIGEQDFVVGRWTASGTHLGSWSGLEASGRRVSFSAANIFRFEHGKVAEIWNHRDDLGFREQVGAAIYAGAAPED